MRLHPHAGSGKTLDPASQVRGSGPPGQASGFLSRRQVEVPSARPARRLLRTDELLFAESGVTRRSDHSSASTTMSTPHLILWRWMDRPGHEAARLEQVGGEWQLAGTSVFADDGAPCRLSYLVVCDASWRTLRARVDGWVGARAVGCEIAVDGGGRWRLDGQEVPEVAGCVDVDLNFSPSTNLLPIRRLRLGVGQEGAVSAAWLRFPSFGLERLDQTYRRTDERAYRYSSAVGAFVRDIQVNEAGLVTLYPDFWEAEPGLGG